MEMAPSNSQVSPTSRLILLHMRLKVPDTLRQSNTEA